MWLINKCPQMQLIINIWSRNQNLIPIGIAKGKTDTVSCVSSRRATGPYAYGKRTGSRILQNDQYNLGSKGKFKETKFLPRNEIIYSLTHANTNFQTWVVLILRDDRGWGRGIIDLDCADEKMKARISRQNRALMVFIEPGNLKPVFM